MKTKIAIAGILISSCLTSWAWFPPSITQEKLDQIKIGVTTEADLVHLFGPPSTHFIDLKQQVADDWFRSVPMPIGGYLPFIGELCGGLHVDAQQLTVLLTPDGRVLRFEAHSSRQAFQQQAFTAHRNGHSKEK